MTWTTLTFDFASKLTSTKMTQLYDNITALANGDSGAPPITHTAIGSAEVRQANLRTTTGDIATTSLQQLVTGPGGEYGFWPTIKNSNSGGIGVLVVPASGNDAAGTASSTSPGTSLTNRFFLGSTGSQTTTARQRYIQSSPPYDLGYGEIPLFIFAMVNASGDIISTYIAEDPPWANNGPTCTRPDFWRDGKPYQKRLKRPDAKLSMADRLAALAKSEFEEIEVTQAIKQADMPLIPHPWLGNDLAGFSIIMLDPLCKATSDCLTLMQAGEFPGELLHEGYFNIDNTPKIIAGPPTVLTVGASWKNSK